MQLFRPTVSLGQEEENEKEWLNETSPLQNLGFTYPSDMKGENRLSYSLFFYFLLGSLLTLSHFNSWHSHVRTVSIPE